ncbi:MAG TPA: ABC transporter permease subunit [Candidatus Limnocylindrales bacterium]|nr:ABC transporter permease subunit [Candidatus Limnocylindrales bacterium]
MRALSFLTLAVLLRLLREGLVVRAMAWPGLLASLALVGTAGAYAAWGTTPDVYVSTPELVAPLQTDGFRVFVVENPEPLLLTGQATRAIWREGDIYVLGRTWGGRATHRAESVLREAAGDRWRLEIPPLEARPGDVRNQAALLAGIIALLFTLYGVVMGAGALYRDRSNGALEAELALPVPVWMHACARVLALTAVLSPALIVSLLVVDSLMAIDHLTRWLVVGTSAAVAGGAIGFAMMARGSAEKGFSGPLSRALTATMALMAVGWWQPGIGRFLPLLSLGSFMHGAVPSYLVAAGAAAAVLLVTADFRNRECV